MHQRALDQRGAEQPTACGIISFRPVPSPAGLPGLVSGSGRRSAGCSLAPLVISDTEFDLVFDALHHGLELADTELAASPAAGTW
jgi:hypothetical protein